jgi:hypothetical protein
MATFYGTVFYGIMRMSKRGKDYGYRLFFFLLFQNFCSVSLLIDKVFINNYLHYYIEPYFPFIIGFLIATLITFIFYRRYDKTIEQQKHKSKSNLTFVLVSYFVSSLLLFIAAAVISK